jgi:nicotinate-nucleotide--dimethylbenzimidazole phosphoribosyltransferase
MSAAWPRPVPTVGDPSSAAERSSDPTGWAFPDRDREALHRVLAARRDIRRFRADAVDEERLLRLLAAAHTAPSVGHSQPWRFVVVTDPATRARAAVLADRARLAQAGAMDAESARHLLDLDLEGIREAPLGLVVCCDRRASPLGVLGRATFVDADMWSCACAIENLWLAARAEGLGIGWVTLFEPGDLAALVDAPEGIATLGWLCVGWPDERPPSPGLERRGWSERVPLEQIVIRERWAAPSGAPAPPPSHLAPPAQSAIVAARDTGDRILTAPGSLGVLDRAVDKVLALAASPEGGRLVLAAADHAVTRQGVSAYPPEVTRHVAEAALAGTSVGAVAARSAGLEILVVDAGVAGSPLAGAYLARPLDPRGDLVHTDGLTAADTDRLVAAGLRLASGRQMVALGEVGVGNTTVAAAVAAGLLGVDPAPLIGLGAGSDSAIRQAKRTVVAAAVARLRARTGHRAGPLAVLAALGGGEVAVLTGVVLGVAAAGGVVVLDGMATSVAALVAAEAEPAVVAHLIAGQRSREPGHQVVLAALGLEPILDLRLRAGEGVGAALAVRVLSSGMRIRLESARVHDGEAARVHDGEAARVHDGEAARVPGTVP